MFETENKRYEDLQDQLKGKIDGEIDMDMHGNVVFRMNEEKREAEQEGGIQGSGTYILRDGKLVPGKSEVRE